jgi:hypothetical protein
MKYYRNTEQSQSEAGRIRKAVGIAGKTVGTARSQR